jgi:hypothetical protein
MHANGSVKPDSRGGTIPVPIIWVKANRGSDLRSPIVGRFYPLVPALSGAVHLGIGRLRAVLIGFVAGPHHSSGSTVKLYRVRPRS